MKKNQLISGIALTVLLNITACGGSDKDQNDVDQQAGESMFNPDLTVAENTGEPGGDISAIAGLWDGTLVTDTTDIVYWNLAANGVLTRYDYQQDGAVSASGENCYLIGEPITVTPEGGIDFSFFDVAVNAERSDNVLTITFIEPDKNDLDRDDDIAEMPTLIWMLLESPVLEDLNSCASENETTEEEVVVETGESTNLNLDSGSGAFPIGIGWADIPRFMGEGKPYITRAECTSNGGITIGDPGDGSVFQPEFRCASGAEPVAYITYLDGESISIEGEVCCV